MRFIIIILVFALTSCAGARLDELAKLDSNRFFILTEEHLRTEYRGMINAPWIEGLYPGTYREIAQDKDGTYFMGNGHLVVTLGMKPAEEYLNSTDKIINPAAYIFGRSEGGLWLPKEGSKKKARLFFVLKQAHHNVGGLVGASITVMHEGTISFIPFDSEVDFLNSIKLQTDNNKQTN